ncbi:MAG: phosphotransferase [Rhodobacteraceae bacterium]|nr:phosphotransferase [Paracoccaceae bacterium]
MTDDSPLLPALADALKTALSAPPTRILPLSVDGRRYWLKRPERHRSLLRRMQKGDPARAIEADRAGLRRMAALGLPAPRLLASGADFLLTEDVGAPVATLLRDPSATEADRHAALADGARALAALHQAGVAHGRPKIRDVCWAPDRGAAFIDFEEFREPADTAALARDAMVYLHSVLQLRRQRDALFDTAAEAYRAAAPAGVWEAMRIRVARIRWIAPLARLVLWVQPKAHEVRAALLLHAALGD